MQQEAVRAHRPPGGGLLDHPQQHQVEPDAATAQPLVAQHVLRFRDARGEQRREDDALVGVGEVRERVPVALGGAAVPVHDDQQRPGSARGPGRHVEAVGEPGVRPAGEERGPAALQSLAVGDGEAHRTSGIGDGTRHPGGWHGGARYPADGDHPLG